MAEPVARKELKLRLTLEQDLAKGGEAMKALAKDAQKVEENAGKANRELRAMNNRGNPTGGNAGNPNTPPAPGPGPNGGGNELGLKDLAFKAAAATAAVAGLASTTAGMVRAHQALDNELLTGKDKLLGFAQAIPLVGSSLASLANNLIDMAARLRDPKAAKELDQARMTQGLTLAEREARFGGRQQARGLLDERLDAGARARVFRETGGFRSRQAALAGVLGVAGLEAEDPRQTEARRGEFGAARELRVAEEQRLNARAAVEVGQKRVTAAEEALQKAAAEARAAGAAAGVGRKAGGAAPAPRRSQTGEFLDRISGLPIVGPLAGVLGRPGGIADQGNQLVDEAQRNGPYEMALMKEAKAQQRLLQAQHELQASLTREKEKQLAVDKASVELEQRRVDIMKVRLTQLDEEAAKVKGGLTQLGGLDGLTQDDILESFQRFKRSGRNAVTAGEFSRFQSLGLLQNDTAQQSLDAAQKSPVVQRLMQLTGTRDLETITREQVKLRTDIDLKVEFNEQQTTELLKKTLDSLNGQLQSAIFKIVETRVGQLQNQDALGRAVRGVFGQ